MDIHLRQPDVMQMSRLGPFIQGAQDCIAEMLKNGRYIHKEPTRVPTLAAVERGVRKWLV